MFNNDNFKSQVVGFGVGASTFLGAQMLMGIGTKPYYKLLQKDFDQFNENEIKYIKHKANFALISSPLYKMGCRIDNVTEENCNRFLPIFKENMNKYLLKNFENKINKIKTLLTNKKNSSKIEKHSQETINKYKTKLEKKGIKKRLKNAIRSVADGENAFYFPITKEAVVNMDKKPALAFHEMGHAINSLGLNKAGKVLTKLRNPFFKLTPIIALVGLLKPKKQEGEKAEGIADKTTTFIKNNAGKLTFAALLPKLAEEGLASLNAKQLLKMTNMNKSIAKRINISNFKAWGTYLLGAIILSQATRFAIYAHDKIVENK